MPRILLVEDDPTVQAANKTMLTKLGCEVVVTDTGMSGITKAKNGENFDIYFVDLGLPDILGYEVLSAIREERGEEVPVIAITGYTGEMQKVKCIEAGATEVLHKPVMSEGLKNILIKYNII